MSVYRTVVTDDVARVMEQAGAFLRSEPVQHNLILTLLKQRSELPEPGLYGLVAHDDEVVGVSFQSPRSFIASITPMPPGAIEPLVDALAAASPELPGVAGRADAAARFAGCWAERLKMPAAPVEGQRLYELRSLLAPPTTPGALRAAVEADVELVVEWLTGFERDTGSLPTSTEVVRHRVDSGLVWIWQHGEAVAMAGLTDPIEGVSRVGHVYTPPEHRRHGYAAACTAALSQVAFDRGAERCVLYTQLENPVSNAIYRRLGYEPVSEQTRYRFGIS